MRWPLRSAKTCVTHHNPTGHPERCQINTSEGVANKPSHLDYRLWRQDRQSALLPKADFTAACNQHVDLWLKFQESPEYQAGPAEGLKIERRFGEGRRRCGLGRCRYLGPLRYGVRSQLTVLFLNLTGIFILLTGVRSRSGARAAAPRAQVHPT
jgi:hypothetical protein